MQNGYVELALLVSVRHKAGSIVQRLGFVAIGLICLVAVFAGAPAEG